MNRRSEAGFTLLELLVALTVLAVLMVLMFGGLRFGARVWETGDAGLRGIAEMQTAATLIRRTISQAVPTGSIGTAAEGAAVPAFRGTAAALRLIGPAPSQLLPGGLYETILGLEDGIGSEANGGRRLSVRWRPLPRGAVPGVMAGDQDWRTKQVVLLDGIADLRLRYFGQSEDGDDAAPRWHDRWETMLALPDLVSIRIGFMPGDQRTWPEIVVAPMASAY